MRSVICPTYLHFHDLASHFLALTAGDRFLRFGWVMTDVDIVAYVESLLQSVGNVFVVVEPAPEISGVLQIEFTNGGADMGLSVSAWARGKGIGTLLLERAALLASGRGVSTLFVRNLNFNAALRRLAHEVGMQVAYAPDPRSTRLDVPRGSEGGVARGRLAGAITLVDHSLRSQWSLAVCTDSSAEELGEPLPT
jgi:GNAT superfamily N-acetyltransferase